MEIINSPEGLVTEPVKTNVGLMLEEETVDRKFYDSDISDKNRDILEFVKVRVTERTPVQALMIARRIPEFKPAEVYSCLKNMWRAGYIRRFRKIRYRMTRAQPQKSQCWYLIHNVKEYILPKVELIRNTKRGTSFQKIPDEVVAQIRRYGNEITVEEIAIKHNISIWYVEKLRAYERRPTILP